MSDAFEVSNLRVQRGATEAVQGASFRFAGPGWYGIIGANGSGKTSLLRAIAGRLELSGGSVSIDGIDRTGDRVWRAKNIGFAPEGAMLPNTLTPCDLYAVVAPVRPATMSTGLSQLYQALGIEALLYMRIGGMSAGMRQRVAIFSAFAAAHDQRVVILDEPFNWLDPVASYDTKAALSALVADGLTLVTALHDLNSLALVCDAGMMMAEGQVVAELSTEDLAQARLDLGKFEHSMMKRLRSSSSPANGVKES